MDMNIDVYVTPDDKRCSKCNQNMHKMSKADQKVINAETLANKVTEWLKNDYSMSELVLYFANDATHR